MKRPQDTDNSLVTILGLAILAACIMGALGG